MISIDDGANTIFKMYGSEFRRDPNAEMLWINDKNSLVTTTLEVESDGDENAGHSLTGLVYSSITGREPEEQMRRLDALTSHRDVLAERGYEGVFDPDHEGYKYGLKVYSMGDLIRIVKAFNYN